MRRQSAATKAPRMKREIPAKDCSRRHRPTLAATVHGGDPDVDSVDTHLSAARDLGLVQSAREVPPARGPAPCSSCSQRRRLRGFG